jgi:hypothetical protein
VHIVYSIEGCHSAHAYYGYCAGTDETTQQNIKDAFLIGATRPDPERGDVRLFAENHQDETSLEVTIIDVFEEEMDAWLCRNEQRSLNHNAITGPTMFPGNIAARAAKEHPETLAQWAARLKQRGAKTARQAWALGLWTSEVIKELPLRFPKSQVMTDLDKLSPIEFSVKYSI